MPQPSPAHVSASGAASGEGGYYLCLNAAEGLLQLLIVRREEAGPASSTPLCFQSWHAPSQGAELLVPALAGALKRLGLVVRDIRGIACTRGPGSFTGLRLTLATAAGLARSTGAAQAGIEYLPILAHSACRRLGRFSYSADEEARGANTGSVIWTLTHARKNLVHMQGFRASFHERAAGAYPLSLSPLTGIHVCTPHEAALFIGEYRVVSEDSDSGRPLVLGSGLSRNYRAFTAALGVETASEAVSAGGHGQVPMLLTPDFDHPLAEALLDAAAFCEYFDKDIEPLYARPADAEENMDRIAVSLGINPAEAREKLSRLMRELHITS